MRFTILPALLLSGCMLGRHYEAPSTEAYEEASYEFASEQIFVISDSVDAWWTLFGDDVLVELIERALAANHDIEIAIAKLLEARAFVDEASRELAPEAQARGDVRYTMPSLEEGDPLLGRPKYWAFDIGFDAIWELDFFRRLQQAKTRQEMLYAARSADLDAVRISIVAELARQYCLLRGAQEKLRVTLGNIDLLDAIAKLTAFQKNQGRGTQLDVERVLADLALAKATAPSIKAEISAAINRVAILIGEPPSSLRAELSAPLPLPPLPSPISIVSPATLLRQRPDIRSAERELAAAVADYNVNFAELFPQVTLNGNLAVFAKDADLLFTEGAFGYSAGPSIRWSILNFGRIQAQIDAADARSHAALENYHQRVLSALEELDTAMSALHYENERYQQLSEAVESIRSASELTRKRLELGVDDAFDVLDVQRQQLQAEQLKAESATLRLLNAITLYKALGGRFS